MSNGDPVTQKQFYETMNGSKREILDAVEKVNGHVQENKIALATVTTKIEQHDDEIKSLKLWNKTDTVVSGVVVTVLAALGLREQ